MLMESMSLFRSAMMLGDDPKPPREQKARSPRGDRAFFVSQASQGDLTAMP
jgi:hypothetical protein